MHKTLSARLAEHIQTKGLNSLFYRTGPAQFYTHDLAKEPGTPEEFKTVHHGFKRTKSIKKENVLVAPRDLIRSKIYGSFVDFNPDDFADYYNSFLRFMDREAAEDSDEVKQFVTFTIVYNGDNLLTYRRGKFTTTSDLLKGQLSVGFGGHVNDKDFDLFNQLSEGFRANAARELTEELFLEDFYNDISDAMQRTRILGYINVDESRDAEHHIAVLIGFEHASAALPKKGELSINQLSWLNINDIPENRSHYDLWSRLILENISNKTLRLSP